MNQINGAAPILESFILLLSIDKHPGLKKGDMAFIAAETAKISEYRLWISYIDSLLNVGYLFKHDFTYTLSPSGKAKLEELKVLMRNMLNRSL
jgi:hypothetical protein